MIIAISHQRYSAYYCRSYYNVLVTDYYNKNNEKSVTISVSRNVTLKCTTNKDYNMIATE